MRLGEQPLAGTQYGSNYTPTSHKDEAGGLSVWGQLELHSEFWTRLGNLVRLSLKRKIRRHRGPNTMVSTHKSFDSIFYSIPSIKPTNQPDKNKKQKNQIQHWPGLFLRQDWIWILFFTCQIECCCPPLPLPPQWVHKTNKERHPWAGLWVVFFNFHSVFVQFIYKQITSLFTVHEHRDSTVFCDVNNSSQQGPRKETSSEVFTDVKIELYSHRIIIRRAIWLNYLRNYRLWQCTKTGKQFLI